MDKRVDQMSSRRLERGGFGILGRFVRGRTPWEMALGISIIALVVMMVVPLTPVLLDVLISINIGLSVLVIALALFIRRPLTFNAFPTLLLIATLYRLALNVSSTRLILLQADAGRIIAGFGGVVVGGDILVGAVVFAILAMVLFLVITKGAERVAEVSARFSLDALPGMQIAIDSDVRTGAVSSGEAVRMRVELDRRSRYYGSLDGAMKFVRGDALAGLVIILVNIVGGLAVGIGRQGMSLEQALDTYTRLTIGDGLVTMLPALLVSTAAGLLVTRVGQGDEDQRLGAQLRTQLFNEPRALGAASLALLVLAMVPGLPMWPFLLLGGVFGAVAVVQFRIEMKNKLISGDAEKEITTDESRVAVIEVGDRFYGALKESVRDRGGMGQLMGSLALPLRDELGFPVGVVPVLQRMDKEARDRAVLMLRGIHEVPIMVMADPAARDLSGLLESFETETKAVLTEWADRMIGMDEVQLLVDRLARKRPVLVRESVPKVIKIPALTELLQRLLKDRISLDHLPTVLDAIAKRGDSRGDELLQTVRKALSLTITNQLQNPDGEIEAVSLAREVEAVLADSLTRTAQGHRLVLEPDLTQALVEKIRKATCETEKPAIIVPANLRTPMADWLRPALPKVTVVTSAEFEPGARVRVLETIDV